MSAEVKEEYDKSPIKYTLEIETADEIVGNTVPSDKSDNLAPCASSDNFPAEKKLNTSLNETHSRCQNSCIIDHEGKCVTPLGSVLVTGLSPLCHFYAPTRITTDNAALPLGRTITSNKRA